MPSSSSSSSSENSGFGLASHSSSSSRMTELLLDSESILSTKLEHRLTVGWLMTGESIRAAGQLRSI
jgi:hypothetical protein